MDLNVEDMVTLEGIEPEPLKASGTLYDGAWVLSEGVTTNPDICNDLKLATSGVEHATLTLTGGTLDIGRRTRHQWEFKPGPDGKGEGIKWRLVNQVVLKARLGGDRLTVKNIAGRDLVFIPQGNTLTIDFGNAPTRCLSSDEGKLEETPTPDEHFGLYYSLLQHSHKEPHLPWGRKTKKEGGIPTVPSGKGFRVSEEGGGCPPLFIRR